MKQQILIWEREEYLVNKPIKTLEKIVEDLINDNKQIICVIPLEYFGAYNQNIEKCLIIYNQLNQTHETTKRSY